jgi:hypothetical protein
MALHNALLFVEDLGLANHTTMRSLDAANATLFSNHSSTNTSTTGTEMHDGNPLLYGLLSLGWFLLFYYCCCRSKIPDERLWRGEEIRQRALEERLRQRAQEARDNQSPLERKRLVHQAMITKVRIRGQCGNVVTYDYKVYIRARVPRD